jgi:hypothetical protein
MITPDLLVQAVQAIDRRAKFCFADADINTIEWLEGYTPIPLADIQAQLDQLVAAEPRKEAEAKRASAYRSEADPLFFKAQRGEATTDEWTAKVAEIKARFPYPGGEE